MEKIIYDCDNTFGMPLKEVDDGLTILYLLGTPVIDLLGITTTFGNGRIDQVYSQTQKLIEKMGVKIPILCGEDEQALGKITPASKFLAEQVDRYPGEITVLATGPVGNLHTAALENPEFFRKVKRIIVMGGYRKQVKLGYRDLKELNFSANPKATLQVLTAPCPLTVFPAQACLNAPYRFKDIYLADYWPGWIKCTLAQWLIAFGLYTGRGVFYLWDLLPAVYLTKPALFKSQMFNLGSTLADLTQGLLIEAQNNADGKITLVSGIGDPQGFYAELNRGWRESAKKYPL
jgi:purine nucleosidase